ncbi:DUF4365 domain-containing protein [Marinobacter sp. CHS3-4]|uniref:DUF4365 domain-containing protein n=1 Tax=Marinobacter sp. CHS3-4 TaxID=3045174 RepID=UPI0024B616FB|nr:DUF4365 domain-containing protein [Marinobacter sp. CHS3-4]MDI9244591.1 DUF4365 domain-containing protein [Marinobacter sp. CHS3-4]
MELPKYRPTDFTERAGVFSIAAQVTSLGLIFRETPNSDVGIDAQIELVSGDQALGKLIAVQAKSGKSYLNDKGDHYAFYPKEAHRHYWETFPLPVVVMLHDPESDKVYFSDARYYLSIPERERTFNYIPVFKKNCLNSASKEDLFQLPSIDPDAFLEMPELLKEMVETRHWDGSFPVSFFEIFVHSLTNLCRHSFFDMQIPLDLAEYNLAATNSELGVGVNFETHEFLNSYVRFLMAQNLVQVDYSDYLIDWNERQMLPSFLSPLTSRGRELIRYIREVEDQLFERDEYQVSVACDRFVRMFYAPSDERRFAKISIFSQRHGTLSD